MLAEAVRRLPFILRERPNAGPSAAQTSRPASHTSESDLGGPRPRPVHRKVGRLGRSAEGAHSIFRLIPARMSARARAKVIEARSPGQEMPFTCVRRGRAEGLCDLSARWRATGRTMYVEFLPASPGNGVRNVEGARGRSIDTWQC